LHRSRALQWPRQLGRRCGCKQGRDARESMLSSSVFTLEPPAGSRPYCATLQLSHQSSTGETPPSPKTSRHSSPPFALYCCIIARVSFMNKNARQNSASIASLLLV
jgi:hypothetical protein